MLDYQYADWFVSLVTRLRKALTGEKQGVRCLMSNSLSSGLQLTLIDMAIVFAVLYAIALVINITRIALTKVQRKSGPPEGNSRGGMAHEGRSADTRATAGTGDNAMVDSSAVEAPPIQQDSPMYAEGETVTSIRDDLDTGALAAVISAAVAAYITDQRPEVPAFAVPSAGGAVAAAAVGSPWVMHGRFNQLNRWPRRPAKW